MYDIKDDFSILRDFLQMSWESDPVLTKFANLRGAINFPSQTNERFVYVPGRPGMPLLCAHADVYAPFSMPLRENEEKFFRYNDFLGADDRAGCALLWEFRNSGCGLLIFDGEEHGCCASTRLCNILLQPYAKIFFPKKLYHHYTFIITPDLPGEFRWKTYDCATSHFLQKVIPVLGKEPDADTGWTDAAVLGDFLHMNVCNLAVGYFHPHTKKEFLNKQNYLWTRQKIQELLIMNNIKQPIRHIRTKNSHKLQKK